MLSFQSKAEPGSPSSDKENKTKPAASNGSIAVGEVGKTYSKKQPQLKQKVLGTSNGSLSVAGGATLRARALHRQSASPGVEETREILQEIREKDKLEREAEVENIKQNIKKTKRCLAKEVDGIVREKMGMKRKKEGDRTSPDRDKKPKKKKFSTPKGQRKLTSFFSKP